MRLFDSHCHLDAPEFDADRQEVLERARRSGVAWQVVPAVDFAGWPKLRELCVPGSGLFPAYGLHPMYLEHHQEAHLAALPGWIERENPVAVGECGLDFFVEGLDPDRQRHYCRRQLQIASEFDLPVVLHARRALQEVIAMLRDIGGLRGVVHSFSGSEEQARLLFGLGFSIGIGGPVTYDRAQRLRRIVATMPSEFLLLETDAPDQPDSAHRGERNEPSRLPEVLRVIAELRGESEQGLAEAATANAQRLFKLV